MPNRNDTKKYGETTDIPRSDSNCKYGCHTPSRAGPSIVSQRRRYNIP